MSHRTSSSSHTSLVDFKQSFKQCSCGLSIGGSEGCTACVVLKCKVSPGAYRKYKEGVSGVGPDGWKDVMGHPGRKSQYHKGKKLNPKTIYEPKVDGTQVIEEFEEADDAV